MTASIILILGITVGGNDAPAEHKPSPAHETTSAHESAETSSHAPSAQAMHEETAPKKAEHEAASHSDASEPSLANPSKEEHATSKETISVHHEEEDAQGHKAKTKAHVRPKLDSGTLAGPLPGRNFVWRARLGPLLLKSDVIVGPGQTLEIGPGTEVRIAARDAQPAGQGDWVDSQYVSLIVNGGTLRILGTPKRPVRFFPLRKGTPPYWGGIRIVDTHKASQVEIAWADIPRAHIGIDLERSVANLRHLVVRDASVGIRVVGGAAPEITHSIVIGSRIAGLHSERSGPVVRSCIFIGNSGPGIRFDGLGLARLESNDFWDNAGGDILHGPSNVGGWTRDSIVKPDKYGNVRTNPVFRASSLHASLLARKQDSLRLAPIWKRRLPVNPYGDGPWALSPFSPLLDRGSLSPLCRDPDGSACDIGLWGGTD